MHRFIVFLITVIATQVALAQTVIIDYEERTIENTAAIHIMEAKQTIENEEFEDIVLAKTKLVRILENYRSDGYLVQTSNVSTHKHGKGFHYHYQYVVQKQPDFERYGVESRGPEDTRRELRQQIIEKRREGAESGEEPAFQMSEEQRQKERERRERAREDQERSRQSQDQKPK